MFCPTHKVLMRPVAGVLTCPNPDCGKTKTAKAGELVVKGPAADDEKKSVMVDAKDKLDLLPTTEEYACDKCGGRKAYYYMRQTRSADEATTRFLECTDCGFKWREYR